MLGCSANGALAQGLDGVRPGYLLHTRPSHTCLIPRCGHSLVLFEFQCRTTASGRQRLVRCRTSEVSDVGRI